VLFVGLRLDAEDAATLERHAKAEKLTRSDILRRALRAYGTADRGDEPIVGWLREQRAMRAKRAKK